jgi:hypothetical protein
MTPVEDAAHKYIRIFNELGKLGKGGFAVMLDSASPEEVTALLQAAEIIQREIERTKPLLGL